MLSVNIVLLLLIVGWECRANAHVDADPINTTMSTRRSRMYKVTNIFFPQALKPHIRFLFLVSQPHSLKYFQHILLHHEVTHYCLFSRCSTCRIRSPSTAYSEGPMWGNWLEWND
ncbi:hypothetical protein EV426DRAFT_207400 [Tirmania nivea]|nr:hypothetical protein EV426DRAFT_207400 [Tirmania nivea]